MAKDYEDDVSLFEELLKEYEEEEDAEEVGTPVSPDQLPQPQQQMPQSRGGGGGDQMLATLLSIGAKAALGAATGGAGTGIPMFIPAADGGQVKKKTKKKKRVVRGVGAAKRGYGKATYSKKMY